MIKASWDQFWASWLIKEKSVAAVTVYVFIGKFGCFLAGCCWPFRVRS